jgi:hypothetical protein
MVTEFSWMLSVHTECILDKIDEYRRNWFLHLQRMPPNRIPLKSWLQTTRKKNNWKTEETLATAVVTLETERTRGSNPWCLWGRWCFQFTYCFVQQIILSGVTHLHVLMSGNNNVGFPIPHNRHSTQSQLLSSPSEAPAPSWRIIFNTTHNSLWIMNLFLALCTVAVDVFSTFRRCMLPPSSRYSALSQNNII